MPSLAFQNFSLPSETIDFKAYPLHLHCKSNHQSGKSPDNTHRPPCPVGPSRRRMPSVRILSSCVLTCAALSVPSCSAMLLAEDRGLLLIASMMACLSCWWFARVMMPLWLEAPLSGLCLSSKGMVSVKTSASSKTGSASDRQKRNEGIAILSQFT